MYKVLIVDDAIWVCNLINKLIDWEKLGLKLISFVKNGIEAIDIIEKEKPDIVITDIRMPGMDGLELINKIKQKYKDTQFIIISGYQDFEYAQKAIQYGVKNYILKPIDKKELNDTLENVKLGLKKIYEDNMTRKNIKKNLENKVKRLKQEAIRKVFNKNSVNDYITLNNEYGFSFKKGIYQVYIFALDFKLNINKETKISSIYDLIHEEFIINLNNIIFENIIFINNNNIVIVFNFDIANKKIINKKMKELFNFLKSNSIRFHADITLGIGNTVEGIQELYSSYNYALIAVRARRILGSNKIIDIKDVNHTGNISEVITAHKEKDFADYLETYNIRQIKTLTSELFKVIKNNDNYAHLYYDICTELVEIANRVYKRIGLDIDINDISNKLDEIDSLQNIESYIINFFEDIISKAKDKEKGKNRKAIEMAKKYIHENYSEDISLSDVASFVYLNTSYFSELFKKEEGINFSEYLTNYRLNIAKELLKDIKYKISDVAYLTGYKNSKYFSQLFKKNVGLSPAEYRKIF